LQIVNHSQPIGGGGFGGKSWLLDGSVPQGADMKRKNHAQKPIRSTEVGTAPDLQLYSDALGRRAGAANRGG
jgi:hypothetical protein